MGKQVLVDELANRINECLSLMLNTEKREITSNLITRYAGELANRVEESEGNEEKITKFFKNYVNKVLSTVETMDLSPIQYKAAKKLINSEIYDCLKEVVKQEVKK